TPAICNKRRGRSPRDTPGIRSRRRRDLGGGLEAWHADCLSGVRDCGSGSARRLDGCPAPDLTSPWEVQGNFQALLRYAPCSREGRRIDPAAFRARAWTEEERWLKRLPLGPR